MEHTFDFGKLYLHNNDYISNYLIKHNNWESYHDNIIDKYINKDSVVLDIGANIGVFSIKCGKKCKHIYSFEPYINNYNLLVQNIHLNNFTNITPYFFGISDKLNITKINWITPTNFGAIGLDISLDKDTEYCKYVSNLTKETDKYTVMTNSLDNLNLDKVDFIKIDTEGCEYLCIKGAIKLIEKCKPVMIIEHNNEIQKNNTLNYLHNNNLNYSQINIDKMDYLYILN